MQLDLFSTIEQGKLFLEENKFDGVDCPCCGQYYKVWKKKPISTAVASLCRLVMLQSRESKFYHLDDFNIVPKDRNFSQLINWELIQPMSNEDPDKRSYGFWKATENGKMFVKDKLSIPAHVFTLDNKVIGYSDNKINVKEALGNKFSYQELVLDNYSLLNSY